MNKKFVDLFKKKNKVSLYLTEHVQTLTRATTKVQTAQIAHNVEQSVLLLPLSCAALSYLVTGFIFTVRSFFEIPQMCSNKLVIAWASSCFNLFGMLGLLSATLFYLAFRLLLRSKIEPAASLCLSIMFSVCTIYLYHLVVDHPLAAVSDHLVHYIIFTLAYIYVMPSLVSILTTLVALKIIRLNNAERLKN